MSVSKYEGVEGSIRNGIVESACPERYLSPQGFRCAGNGRLVVNCRRHIVPKLKKAGLV